MRSCLVAVDHLFFYFVFDAGALGYVAGKLPFMVHYQKLGKDREYFRAFFFFSFLRAEPVAYGSSQARGRVRGAAASHSHSNPRSEPHLQPALHLMAMPDP